MKMDITIAIPGIPFNGNTFDKLSIGGSESAGYYTARALARLGNRVTVFCNTAERAHCADVDYLPLDQFRQYVEYTPHDVCIVQRLPELFSVYCRARFSVLWCHDLALGRQEDKVKGVAWNYDKIFVLSDFMRKQYQSVYGLPDELLFTTRNGVDLETVTRVREGLSDKAVRNPLALVYSARPERGLDVLLAEIMPRVLQQEPKARLFLSTYHNPVDELRGYYAQCDALAARLGDRVVKLGTLTKTQLYEVFHASGVYVYPTPAFFAPDFSEISCISFMEAMACGLPIVSSENGALQETLAPGAGVLIKEPMHTSGYYDAFVAATVKLMHDREAWASSSSAGLERAKALDWGGVAREWSELFERELTAFSADKATLANHFWRRSDIYAAKACLDQLPADDVKSTYVRKRVERDWAFALSEQDGFRRQYERIGATHDAAVINWAPQEPRYIALREWLQRRFKEQPESAASYSMLDYGCAHGAYAVNLLKELPQLHVTGVDLDTHGVQMAYTFAEQFGVRERWSGVVGDYERLSDMHLQEMSQQYDCAVAQEVLEHVEDPAAVLMALESRVKDGGYVYLTIPFGPWEFTDYHRYPYRAHVREFDQHDIHDLLDLKDRTADVTTSVMPFGHSPETDDPLGWFVVQYRVTPTTRGVIGRFDMERKLRQQRPRQTLSVAIIAGLNSEETLHWLLRSLEHVADEVVIANCGLSEEAKRLIGDYQWRDFDQEQLGPQGLAWQRGQRHFLNIKVVPGVDPKTQGFETARNIALENCTQDWVLWIDTDEKLLQPERLNKYLRSNIFQGYSIRQHHFAVDTVFDPDLPVRLFRNNGKLKFFGMIHEHPEEGLNQGPGRTVVLSDVHIPHMGYLIESGRQRRFSRNYPMLQADIAKYPERLLQKHFIMRDHMLLCNYELQRNGGAVTPEMHVRCREVIKIYREHFLGKGHFTNVDPIQYYSQANAILGEGFDTAFQLGADKVTAPINGVVKVRFASTEDFVTELSHRARESSQRFESRYW